MSLSFTEEQRAFRSSVRGVLERLASATHTRDFIEGRRDDYDEVWRHLDEALALSGLPIPEEFGGQGASWSEVGIVFEELGRTLFPTPYLSMMTAARVLAACRTPEADERLAQIARGVSRPLVAFVGNDRGSFNAAPGADTDPGCDVHVSGTSGLVPYHDGAESVIIEVRGGESDVLVSVPTSALSIEPAPTIDLTRPMCIVSADAALGTVLANRDVPAAVCDARSFIATAIALESVGGADVCLAMTADYARERVQFGKAIGSFQGVKHRLADLLRSFEPARSAAYAALETIDASRAPERRHTASIAKLVADRMYAEVSIESVQLHGAIGFTWEFDLHLHYKRAIANRAVGPSARDHRRIVKSAIVDLVPARQPIGESA